ncbi:unnamed protein product [Cuscuta epithymum]|uniref:At3g05675-like ankyrin-like domain-containing protein n=1 Tax=Cuscuta epithymum TaxID=186058 RepID=A0AAV0DS80_9ASTE|nr:unnamed protein product [Cuscuta epithymum]
MKIGGAAAAGGVGTKKRQRVGSSGRLSTVAVIDSSRQDETMVECSNRPPALRRTPSHSHLPVSSRSAFNDSTSADVVLRLYVDWPFDDDDDDTDSMSAIDSINQPDVQIYLHSDVLRRSKYFAALLSERWQIESNDTADSGSASKIHRLSLGVPSTPGSMEDHVTVLQLLYTDDYAATIYSVSTALSLLVVAVKLIFDDCIKACVRFIEAVPWTEEEELRVCSLIPFIGGEEAKELLVRVAPLNHDSSEDMLHGLILTAIHNQTNMAPAKAFVAKLLRDFSSKELARRVLDRVFETCLKVVKESLEQYSSPDFRGDHDETEAIQRLNLHTAMTNGRHLLWLVERMIELRVADTAVSEWSNQASLTADLQKAFQEDAWRNIVPGLPSVFLRCTCKLASAVASGTILADRQIRMKLVKDWLPVLIACKDNASPLMPNHNKLLYSELEETFLRIISTLPLQDAQELLQKCLSFSTRNVEDCPHLISAFTTWFRRANKPNSS